MDQNRISRGLDKRESVMLRAQVWMPGARAPSDHRIRNLSLSGACIAMPGWLKRGDGIRVTVGHVHDVDATVMWVTSDQAGIRFEHPIDLAAARRSRGSGVVQTGWMGQMSNAYRK
jgi:hypothetical protein